MSGENKFIAAASESDVSWFSGHAPISVKSEAPILGSVDVGRNSQAEYLVTPSSRGTCLPLKIGRTCMARIVNSRLSNICHEFQNFSLDIPLSDIHKELIQLLPS